VNIISLTKHGLPPYGVVDQNEPELVVAINDNQF